MENGSISTTVTVKNVLETTKQWFKETAMSGLQLGVPETIVWIDDKFQNGELIIDYTRSRVQGSKKYNHTLEIILKQVIYKDESMKRLVEEKVKLSGKTARKRAIEAISHISRILARMKGEILTFPDPEKRPQVATKVLIQSSSMTGGPKTI